MATAEFVLVSTDLLSSGFEDLRETLFGSTAEERAHIARTSSATNVRRPLRGIQIKEETFATLSVLGLFSPGKLKNSSAPADLSVHYTTNFLLQSISEQRSEKFQPVTTFGATYGFFFGEQPRMVTFNAILMNTADFQWEVEWWANYEESLRGTRLTDQQSRAYMTYDDVVLEGYIINAITNKTAQTPYEVNLTFTMWVTAVEYLVEPGDRSFPENQAGGSVEFGDPGDLENELGQFVSTTSAVRARNILTITNQGTGLLARLRNTLQTVQGFTDQVGQAIDQAKNFLYGRNLVIPAGFAGSEAISGAPVFVTSSGGVGTVEDFDPNNPNAILNIRLPARIPRDPPRRSTFFDNFDEYPARGEQVERVRQQLESVFQNLPGEDHDVLATQAAIDAFGQFGIRLSEADAVSGRANSELSRALGRTLYGAVNIGASSTGASQALSGLTVGNVP